MHEYVHSSTWLLDVFAKASLLLATVWLGSLIIRKRSAAAQHRWWTLGFAGCILIPVVSLVAPTWTPPLIPSLMQIGDASTVELTPESEKRTALMPTGVITGGPRGVAKRPEIPATAAQAPPLQYLPDERAHSVQQTKRPTALKVANTPPPTTIAQTSFEFSWLGALLTVWAIGVAFFLLRNVHQHWLLSRMLGRCIKVLDTDWCELLGETSDMLGMRTRVELLENADANSPVSAGVWRPVVILSEDARKWSRVRRRLVLLHELAHVARKDVLAQTIARVGCGLLWFNPLAWYGLLQMRQLRETACDDLVLSCGQQPTGYADVLLDIARSYQHQTYATAVAMAHNNNVESRITAILDTTRRHVSLSRTAARILFAFAAALVCLVGTAQFRSQAETPVAAEQKDGGAEQAGETGDDNLRDMRIRILDEQGKPLQGAMLTAGTLYPRDYMGHRIAKHNTADANGTILLRFPPKLRTSLRLWPAMPGYVGQFNDIPENELPELLEFRLAKGHQISGRIVDEDGNPVEGVHVRVKVDGAPGVSTWLTDAFGQPTLTTDGEGRWQLGNTPAPARGRKDYEFTLKLSHDDYVTDEHWGESQQAQGIGTEDFRRGDAKLVLKRGTSVYGPVTDEQGKPITKGWVVWGDEPYFFDGVFEAELKEDGTFRTPPLPVGEHPITIVAPGYAAQRRVVKVGSDPSNQPFKLKPGKRIEIRFVDTAGNPIPKVGVWLANSSSPNTWQNSNALHNHKHPNVPEYGIARSANEEGVFVWDWAPEEPVRYSIGAKGFAPKELSLVPKRDPHIVKLAGARVIEGKVTDTTTGKLIENFRAMPVIVFRPNFFSTRYSDLKKGVDGQYELPLTGSGNPKSRYRVRIEADGYRSIVSEESFGPTDGRVRLDVQLAPAPTRKGRVFDSYDNPIANASIIVGTSTWVPSTTNGEPDSWGERILQSDSDGRFELNATTEQIRLRVIHDAGIFERLYQPEEESIGDVKLQPWAKVSGRLVQKGQPVGNQTIYFNRLVKRGLGEARFQDSYYAQTGPDGTFSFDRLPPGGGSVRPYLGPWRDSLLTSAESLPVELKPGEQREVVIGGEGAVLSGQVVATGRDDVPLDRKYSLNYLVSRDRAVSELPADFPALSFDPSAPMEPSWRLDPRFSDWLGTRENHFVKLTPDGMLQVTGVAPGDYDLVIQLYEQPAGCLVETVGEKIVPVTVEGDGKIDLGQIEVPCRAGPRPGSDMRAFEFVDASGKEQSVYDMKGRYVLMHVWASWCTTCMHSMNDIQQMAESPEAEVVTFVGLNVDGDPKRASDIANQMNWSWSQNYLGDDSDMSRQLALSSVPTYYLIGPEGKLVASATEWSDIKKRLVTSTMTTDTTDER